MENSSDSDTSDDGNMSDGSDIDLNGEGSFSSDTDSDDDQTGTGDTQSSLGTYSSEISDPEEDDFWSSDLTPVCIASFDEDSGPNHELSPNDPILNYFYLMFSENFFDVIADETNRYAEQVFVKKGARDSDWTQTDAREMKAYIGLYILMGIHQLPSLDMYWSQDKFIGNSILS